MNRPLAAVLAFAVAFLPAAAPAAPAPSFRAEVVAVLSRAGCNSGSCHGAFAGKNGFRLSLFGYEPEEDFYRITRESSGRRIDRVDPGRSLLLRKAAGQVTHGGGKRLAKGSPGWKVLLGWLEAGAPADPRRASRWTCAAHCPIRRRSASSWPIGRQISDRRRSTTCSIDLSTPSGGRRGSRT